MSIPALQSFGYLQIARSKPITVALSLGILKAIRVQYRFVRACAMHELHELRKSLLVTSQRFIYDCDHISLAPGNHLAVFAALIAIQYLFYADTNWPLGATCWAAGSTLAELGVPRWLAIANLIFAGIRL